MTTRMVAGFLFLALSACMSRQRLTRTHGASSREAFASQRANPAAGRSPRGNAALDSEDARVIAKTYRDSMAPKGRAAPTDGGRILLVTPPANAPTTMPPPSVPQTGP